MPILIIFLIVSAIFNTSLIFTVELCLVYWFLTIPNKEKRTLDIFRSCYRWLKDIWASLTIIK